MNRIYYSLIFALIATYTFLIYLVMHPKVSDDYRDFFIEKTSNISPYEKGQMAPIQLGELIINTDPRVGFDSFLVPGDFRKTLGKKSKIIVLLDSVKPPIAKGNLFLSFITFGKQKIVITLNKTTIYTGELDGLQNLNILFSGDLLVSGKNIIQFDLPDAHPIGNGESEILALQLKSFRLE